MQLVANSWKSLIESLNTIRDMWNAEKYLVIVLKTKRKRSLDQNALWAAMYERVADSLNDGSVLAVANAKAECKLNLGVLILRRDSEQFEKGWQRYFGGRTYEEQLYLMGNNPLFGADGFPVTRLFTTKQGAEYTEAIVKWYAQAGVFFDDLLNGEK